MKHSNTWFALILILSALLLNAGKKGVNAQQLPRENPAYPTEQSTQHERASHTNEQIADNTVAPIDSVHSKENRNEDTNPASNQEKPDWMVRLTLILCVITAIQAFIFFNQYRAMVFSERAQIVVTPTPSANPVQQQRVVFQITAAPQGTNPPNAPNPPAPQQLQLPAVPAIPQFPDGLVMFGPNQHSVFRATINNIGNTPAYKATIDSWMELVSPPFAEFPANSTACSMGEPRTIYPNPAGQWQVIGVRTDHPMSPFEYGQFQIGQLQLWVRVRVTYRDVFRFRRSRFAEFGWFYSNAGIGVLAQFQDSN
jgi:hypothetical protein